MIKRILFFVFVFTYLSGCFGPEAEDDGVRFPEPEQTSADGVEPWEFRGFQITPLARYDIKARVISTIAHWFFRESEISPIDIAVGWGPMSDPTLYEKLKMGQGGRFYYYSWGPEGPPIPAEQIGTKSANIHIIPANDEIEDKLETVKPFQTIQLRGFLVAATKPDGWHWKSSTSRTDRGHSSCELMWVEEVSISGK